MPMATKEDQRDYQRKWIQDRRKKYVDGKCCYFCEVAENLEVHHVDPNEKEHHSIWSWSENRIKAELAKCIFLCKSCHSKLHGLMKRVPLVHGTYTGFKRYKCKCPLCMAAQAWHTHKYRHSMRIRVQGWGWFVEDFHNRYGISETEIKRITGKITT